MTHQQLVDEFLRVRGLDPDAPIRDPARLWDDFRSFVRTRRAQSPAQAHPAPVDPLWSYGRVNADSLLRAYLQQPASERYRFVARLAEAEVQLDRDELAELLRMGGYPEARDREAFERRLVESYPELMRPPLR